MDSVNLAKLLSRAMSQNGRVLDAGDAEYQTTRQIDNGRISHEPSLVVIPGDAQDVAEVVKILRQEKESVRMTTKCGGHSAAGYCLNTGGVVLDLRLLNALSFDRTSGVLKMGMGTRWNQAYDYMQGGQTGYVPVGGGCPGVGVGGFLLGGGYSFISRSYGLGCDQLQSLTMVMADGSTKKVGPNSKGADADLFWACRGGGGGNFGIAVECEIETKKPLTEEMLMGQIFFPFYRCEQIFDFYNNWVTKLPKEMAVYGFVGFQPDPRHGGAPILMLRFTPVYNGSSTKGYELLREMLALEPIATQLYKMTIPEWERFIGAGTQVNGRSAYIRSLELPKMSLNARAARVFMKNFARCPSQGTFLVWTHAGGAVSDVAADATAFVHRKALFVPEIKSIWDSSKPEQMRANVEWAYNFVEELGAVTGALGSYLNYIDPLLADWPKKYYGANYPRLEAIKKRCDPDDFFAFQQSVGSPFQPSTGMPLDLSPLRNT